MSVRAPRQRIFRFAVRGSVGAVHLELSREDGLDLLEWLGLGRPEFGAIDVRELLPLCRRRLWPEPRNVDPERCDVSGATVRPAGALRQLVTHVVKILDGHADLAGVLLEFG
jgi:hypothetical protein